MAEKDEASRSPTILTRDFIDQRASKFHPAFGEESYFNSAMSRYQSKEISDLEDILKQYQRQEQGKPEFNFDLLKCTWNDVLRELEKAQVAVSANNNRGKKLYQRAWRELGTISDVLAPGLAALPDNLCVLNGGLALIFSLARSRSHERQKILRAFEDIPSVIMMAYGKVESIPRDRPGSDRLHVMIGMLQQTLIRILPVLIARLNPGTFVEKVLSPLKGRDTDDLLADVCSSSERVRVCAEEIMDNIIVSAHQTIHNNHMMSKDIHMITQQTEGEVEELRGKVDEILKHQKSFQTALDAVSGKNSLLSFLMEYLKQPGQCEEEKSPKESPPLYEPATSVTPRQLLGLMNVHHLGALDDEQHIIRRGHSLDSDAVSHAATMFQASQVQRLMHSPESGVVLINACTDKAQSTKISPITNVCATLAHALRRSTRANMVLAFFCGQHSSSDDDLVGPQGLMRSLVAFLVLSLVQSDCISNNAPIWFPDFQGDIEELSFKNICQLFFHLVELAPKETAVYCIVDGISYYERQFWKEEYDIMMECFSSVIASKAITAPFKLLLTSPTVSRWLSDLTTDQRVSLRNFRAKRAAKSENILHSVFENLIL